MCKTDCDILKLGLLFGSLEGDEASVDEQPEWLTFAHKLFQDFAAGFYISKTKVQVKFHWHFKRYADVSEDFTKWKMPCKIDLGKETIEFTSRFIFVLVIHRRP